MRAKNAGTCGGVPIFFLRKLKMAGAKIREKRKGAELKLDKNLKSGKIYTIYEDVPPFP